MKKKPAPKRRKKASTRPATELPVDDRPPDLVTRDRFLVWRFPRVGYGNPHRMTNPTWAWLASRPELNAYMANRHFDGPSSMEVGPGWCANRFGQSRTELADGRVIAVGGEHEDYYDPDFFIYNDVFVTSASGEIDIYGYPLEVFPPTDFHSATLAGDRLVIIGCVGHPRQRVPGRTPVFSLDLTSLAITQLRTDGEPPGWISKHTAQLGADQTSIVVRGGQRFELASGAQVFRDNADDWSLDLGSLSWTRLTDRRWQELEFERSDGKANHLFTIWCMSWHVTGDSPFDQEQRQKHLDELGFQPDFALYAARFTPPVTHRVLTSEDHPRIFCIEVDGVTVRYVEDHRSVRIVVEGPLPEAQVAALAEDARRKLGELEHTDYVVRKP